VSNPLLERERAEVARSHQEAVRNGSGSFRADERQVARYMNPPIDSVFPLEHAFALLGDIRSLTVLDFGCGQGDNSLLLARRGARVIGVDISASLIALARRRLDLNSAGGNTRFVVGSAHEIPLADQSVDMVVGIAVLHHLDLELASTELFRVLKDGGRAIFQEPVRDSRLLRLVRSAIPYQSPDVSPFERPLMSHELQKFASRFRIDSIRAFSLPFVNASSVLPWINRHMSTIYKIDGALLKRFPSLAHLAGIRVVALSKPLRDHGRGAPVSQTPSAGALASVRGSPN
jgi:ubiquinone/menaquinone biosynthesis C-methylase UbiE